VTKAGSSQVQVATSPSIEAGCVWLTKPSRSLDHECGHQTDFIMSQFLQEA